MNRVSGGEQNLVNAAGNVRGGYNATSSGSGMAHHAGSAYGKAHQYLQNKLSGDKKIY